MWLIFALLSAVFAALVAILAKIGMEGVNPDWATAVRSVVILFVAWGFVFAKGAQGYMQALSTKNWVFLVLSGLATGLSWVFYFRALKLAEVSKVAPIDKLSVALSILLAFIILGEQPTMKVLLGAGFIVVGVLIIAL
ncbi:MAG: EamA family transporter [Bacteroidetes bacterium]|nr:EamA family transporter [Bacteroidota bacterium]